MVGENRKPGSVPHSSYPLWGDDHSSRATVAGGLKQPDPGVSDGPSSNTPLFGLAPDGVYRAADVTASTGELLPHPFTLTRIAEAITGGLLSVALSLGSPPVPVKDHPALWSPDFPPPTLAQGFSGRRSPGCLQPHQNISVVNSSSSNESMKRSVCSSHKEQAATVRTGLNFIEDKEAVKHLWWKMHMTTKASAVTRLDNSQTGSP